MKSLILTVALIVICSSKRIVWYHQSAVASNDSMLASPVSNLVTKIPLSPSSTTSSGFGDPLLNNPLSSLLTKSLNSQTSSSLSGWSNTGVQTRLTGVSCSNGAVYSVGTATYGGPTRLTCNNNGQITSDVCTSLQQCATLMCSRYVRCPGRLGMNPA